MAISKEEFIKMSETLISERKNNPGWLYNSGVSTNRPYEVRRLGDENNKGKGPTSGLFNNNTIYGNEYAPDIFAKVFLKFVDGNPKSYFKGVNSAIREGRSYHPRHENAVSSKSNRIEEHEERALFEYYLNNKQLVSNNDISIPYFAMPIRRDKPNELKLKDIDAVGLSADKKTAYLLELKNLESTETLVRSSLEIYTYYSRLKLNRDKDERDCVIQRIKGDFGTVFKDVSDIKPGILLINGGKQYQTYCSMCNEEMRYTNIKRLIEGLDLNVFVVNKYCGDILIPFKNDADFLDYKKVENDETKVRPTIKLGPNEIIRIEKLK